MQAYIQSWKLGAKKISVYRDGSKRTQPLNTSKDKTPAGAFAQAISYALQYGVPLQALVDTFSHVRFEPSGMTRNPEIRFAKSIVDYIFRWMASKFRSPEAQYYAGVNGRALDEVTGQAHTTGAAPQPAVAAASASAASPTPFSTIQDQEDAPPCSTCGSIMTAAARATSASTAATRRGARRDGLGFGICGRPGPGSRPAFFCATVA